MAKTFDVIKKYREGLGFKTFKKEPDILINSEITDLAIIYILEKDYPDAKEENWTAPAPLIKEIDAKLKKLLQEIRTRKTPLSEIGYHGEVTIVASRGRKPAPATPGSNQEPKKAGPKKGGTLSKIGSKPKKA